MRRKRKGAFTLYFGVIFMSILLIALSVLDFARMEVYKAQAQRALEITANSMITGYDKDFQENYGLFMAKKGNLKQKADFLMAENFREGKLSEQKKVVKTVSMNPAEIKEQILEYMKYRGPLIAVSKLYSMFSSLESVVTTGEKFGDRMDTEMSNADFLEALNEYRYYLHGWTFHEDQPDYKYIHDDSSEAMRLEKKTVHTRYFDDLFKAFDVAMPNPDRTNNYFVRSFTDFVKDNPYAPHMDMGNTGLFRNAWDDFDIERYNTVINHMGPEAIGYLTFQIGYLGYEDAYHHDQVMTMLWKELVDRKEKGEEGLEKQIELLDEIRFDRFEYEEMDKKTLQDYKDLDVFSLYTNMAYYMTRYMDYYYNRREEELEWDFVVIDTEGMQSLAAYNLALNMDAYYYNMAMDLTEKNYRILTGLKAANRKAKEKLKDIAKNLEAYKQQVKKEMANLAGADAKDPNYVATVQPQLEDKLEMIKLMQESLQKVQAENKFDENIELLDRMIKKLVVPIVAPYKEFWDNFDLKSFRYYELPVAHFSDEERLSIPLHEKNALKLTRQLSHGEMMRERSFTEIQDRSIALAEATGAEFSWKEADHTIEKESFDKEEFMELKAQYDENCRSMQIDFNKEQLFIQDLNSQEKPQERAKQGSASLSDIMKVAGKIFESIFSFGSGKEIGKKEYQSLPSYIYFNRQDQPEPDEDVFKTDTGSRKKVKKTGKSSKSWFQGIKNIFNGFKKMKDDPLGTLYVNEYIMTAFHSSVTGKGVYKDQINLKFQDKTKYPKKEDLRLESEIEYIIAGERSDVDNNKALAERIIMLRVLPNMLYVFTNSDTSSLASALATAITAIFPPLYPLVYVIIVVLWAVAESIVDVFILRQGEKVAFLKTTGDFMLAPSGFMEIARVFSKVLVNEAADAVKDGIRDGLDQMDQYVEEMTQQAKEFIKNKAEELANHLGADELQKTMIYEYVSDKYQAVEEAVSDYEKSLDTYIDAAVGKYIVRLEKDRAEGKETGEADVKELLGNSDSTICDKIMKVAEENADEVIGLINKKLKKELNPGISGSTEVRERVKNDPEIRGNIEKGKTELRKSLEKKLEEAVFGEIEKEFAEQREKVKTELQNYLNSKIDLGAEKLQSYIDDSLKNVFTDMPEVNATEKTNAGFKLGYEDFLRIYLLFAEEDVKMLRILDLVQLRENKQVSNYMMGVEIEAGFNASYLFLPRLIEIAKKQSSAITVHESDYERVDFRLRSVAGY